MLPAINLRRVPYTGAETSGAETPVPRCPSAEKSQRRNGERRKGGAETVAPKRRRRNVTYRNCSAFIAADSIVATNSST